jgi:hypothetical protein
LRGAGLQLLRTHVPLREALAMAFGQPVRLLHGYDLVAAELLGALPEQPYSVEAVRQRVAPVASLGPNDDELIARLKTSMARLAAHAS